MACELVGVAARAEACGDGLLEEIEPLESLDFRE
jgi:hypothetical protein